MNYMLAVFLLAVFLLTLIGNEMVKRNPRGAIARIAAKMAKPDLVEITTFEQLMSLPDGVVLLTEDGIMVERHQGRWINASGRRQARIMLPARVVSE